MQPLNITTSTIGLTSVLLHLDPSNASYEYDVTIVDQSNNSIIAGLTVFGNSNAYKLDLVNPDPCHLYNVTTEMNYLGKCTPGITTYSLVTFEASEFKY